jgi:DNA primase
MQRLSDSQKHYLRAAALRYHEDLEGSPAAEYLTRRGLGWPSIQQEISRYKLGYVKTPATGHEMYKGFLAIPYLRKSYEHGWSVVSIRFRCIQDHEHTGHGKYMTVAGDRPRLYNTKALLQPSPIVAITEGEIDAITASIAGVPTVGVPGAHNWQEHFPELFYGYKEVYVLADGDDAGRQFANTVAGSLPNAKVIPCPPGEDVNSFVTQHGPKAFMERIKP